MKRPLFPHASYGPRANVLLVIVVGLFTAATPLKVKGQTLQRLSRSSVPPMASAADTANDASAGLVANASGRHFVYASLATDLIEGVRDQNGFLSDVFFYDSEADTHELISVSVAGEDGQIQSGDDQSYDAVVSDDGRFVAYVSWASDLGSWGMNGRPNVLIRDREAGITRLVSMRFGRNESARGTSQRPLISGDGRYLFFESDAPDLVDGRVLSPGIHVFMWDRESGAVTPLTRDLKGFAEHASARRQLLGIDHEGRRALIRVQLGFKNAYLDAANLDGSADGSPESPRLTDLYLFDRQTGLTESIVESRVQATVPWRLHFWQSINAVMSRDGSSVAVRGVAWDVGSGFDRVLWMSTEERDLITVHPGDGLPTRVPGVEDRSGPVISGDGRIVVHEVSFQDGGETRLWLWNADSQTGSLVDTGDDAVISPVLDDDGKILAYYNLTRGGWVVRQLENLQSIAFIEAEPSSEMLFVGDLQVARSGTIRWVLNSQRGDLVSGDSNQGSDLFLMYGSPVLNRESDGDADGMEDAWEQRMFGSLEGNGEADGDEDGVSDLEEFLAGTDPRDAGSVLKVSIRRVAGSRQVFVEWPVETPRAYQIQFRRDLSPGDAGAWSRWPRAVETDGLRAFIVDEFGRDGVPRFYRVVAGSGD